MDELKECPFCGGKGSMRSAPHDEINTEYWVVCHCCAAHGGWTKSESGAIRMWNVRHLTSAIRADGSTRCPDCGGETGDPYTVCKNKKYH